MFFFFKFQDKKIAENVKLLIFYFKFVYYIPRNLFAKWLSFSYI